MLVLHVCVSLMLCPPKVWKEEAQAEMNRGGSRQGHMTKRWKVFDAWFG